MKSTAWQGLTDFMREHRQAWDQGVPDFEQFERELHTHILAVEREFLPAEWVR